MLDRTLCIAPMMDLTDRHQRYFMRLITRRALLYSEMLTTGALIHGDRERLLAFNLEERPVALQVGGSNPAQMAECARMAEQFGYAEVNINVGCPSDRVQAGAFGACLMKEPGTVAACVEAMLRATALPVTVKSRIGVDERDSFDELVEFVSTVQNAGCKILILHARKAWLKGLSPKENRSVPPLRYEMVHRIKEDFPELEVIINGGITSLEETQRQLEQVDGVMIGREAYHNPYMLAEADRLLFGEETTPPTRHEVLERFLPYLEQQFQQGVPLGRITRHILGLFQGIPGARAWRRHLSENAWRKGAGIETVLKAMACIKGDN